MVTTFVTAGNLCALVTHKLKAPCSSRLVLHLYFHTSVCVNFVDALHVITSHFKGSQVPQNEMRQTVLSFVLETGHKAGWRRRARRRGRTNRR